MSTPEQPAVDEQSAVEKAFQDSPSGSGDIAGSATHIAYIGPASTRLISDKDWQGVGLRGETVSWDITNDFQLPISGFTKEQLAVLRKDGYFKGTSGPAVS